VVKTQITAEMWRKYKSLCEHWLKINCLWLELSQDKFNVNRHINIATSLNFNVKIMYCINFLIWYVSLSRPSASQNRKLGAIPRPICFVSGQQTY